MESFAAKKKSLEDQLAAGEEMSSLLEGIELLARFEKQLEELEASLRDDAAEEQTRPARNTGQSRQAA